MRMQRPKLSPGISTKINDAVLNHIRSVILDSGKLQYRAIKDNDTLFSNMAVILSMLKNVLS